MRGHTRTLADVGLLSRLDHSSGSRARGGARCRYTSTNRVQRYTELTTCNGSHSPTLRPTPKAMFFASCAGTENKTTTDALSSLIRHRARHSSMAVPSRWGGGLGELRISSICTTTLADSGEGVLLRQSDNAVVFFPITCDACSASPPLCKTGRYANDSLFKIPSLPRISNLLANASFSRAHFQTSSNRLLYRRCIRDPMLF